MTESSGESQRSNIYLRAEAASSDRQYATYMNDQGLINKAEVAYQAFRKQAQRLRVDKVEMDRAELRGKLRAAQEFGSNEDTALYTQLLKEAETSTS